MINSMMKKFPWANTDTALLVLRIGVGAIFLFTGYIKASNLAGTVGFFATLGFSPFWAYLVTAVELVGGLCVLLGIWTRVAAAFLAITMIVAIYTLRADVAMAMTPFAVLVSTLALKLAGGGKYSLHD